MHKSIYAWSKEKEKEYYRENDYLSIIMNSLCEMFEFTCSDDILPQVFLEYFFKHNIISIGELPDGTLGFGRPIPTGKKINKNGMLDSNEGICINAEPLKNAELFFTNNTATLNESVSNMTVDRFATLLSEVDKSIEVGVVNSRLHPIPVASTGNIKKALDEVLKNIQEGKPTSIVANDLLNENGGITVANITDVATSDKIQYLSQLHNELCKRIYGLYGMPLHTSDKMAQQTELELSGRRDTSMILPTMYLRYMQIICDKVNEKWDKNWSVKFSDLLTHNIEAPTEDELMEEGESNDI